MCCLLCRYDDWAHQVQDGQPLFAMFGAEPLPVTEKASSAAAEQLAAYAGRGERAQWPANCFVVEGAWARNTRYEFSIEVTNPPYSETTKVAPRLWVTPLRRAATQAARDGDADSAASDAPFVISGPSKYGSMCTLPAHRAEAMSTSFDACKAAALIGAVQTDTTSPEACLKAIHATKNRPTGSRQVSNKHLSRAPFLAPPVHNVAAIVGAVEAQCPPKTVYSVRAGGECVRCTWGNIISDADGANPHPAFVVALQHCSNPLSSMLGMQSFECKGFL
jgi:hypothetical protein